MEKFVFERKTPAQELRKFCKIFLGSAFARQPRVTTCGFAKKRMLQEFFRRKSVTFSDPSFFPMVGFFSQCFAAVFLGCPYLKVRSASIAAFRILSTISPHFIWIFKQKYNFPCLLSYIFKCFDAFQKFEFNQTYLTAAAPLALVNIG